MERYLLLHQTVESSVSLGWVGAPLVQGTVWSEIVSGQWRRLGAPTVRFPKNSLRGVGKQIQTHPLPHECTRVQFKHSGSATTQS